MFELRIFYVAILAGLQILLGFKSVNISIGVKKSEKVKFIIAMILLSITAVLVLFAFLPELSYFKNTFLKIALILFIICDVLLISTGKTPFDFPLSTHLGGLLIGFGAGTSVMLVLTLFLPIQINI